MNKKSTLRSVFTLLALPALLSSFVLADTFELRRQNPILRNYFLFQFYKTAASLSISGTHNDGNIDEFYLRNSGPIIDRRIDDFLAKVSRKLESLTTALKEAYRARREALTTTLAPDARRSAEMRWKKSLKEVADQAGDLHLMLAIVLVDLDGKDRFKPKIGSEAPKAGFEEEMKFIEKQITKAERQINHYFSALSHTVGLQDLRDGNMLIWLHRARKMAKKLSSQL